MFGVGRVEIQVDINKNCYFMHKLNKILDKILDKILFKIRIGV